MRTPRDNRNRGGVLVQVILALVVLFGFTALTTDYGLMAARQRKLQSAADAAALAAGPEMRAYGDPAALARAAEFAEANGAEPGGVSAEWLPRGGAALNAPHRVRVTLWSDVPTPFQRVLDSRRVSRRVSAVAEVEAFAAMEINVTAKVRPWGVPIAFFNGANQGLSQIRYNQRAELVMVPDADEQPPPFQDSVYFIQPFALSPDRFDPNPEQTNFEKYRQDVKRGYDRPLGITDSFDDRTFMRSQPGQWDALIAATQAATVGDADGFLRRARQNPAYNGDTFQKFDPENPRLIFLPVYDRAGVDEEIRANILGFTAFYVEDMEGSVVTGYFVPYALPFDGQVLEPELLTSTNMGIIQFRLVQ